MDPGTWGCVGESWAGGTQSEKEGASAPALGEGLLAEDPGKDLAEASHEDPLREEPEPQS